MGLYEKSTIFVEAGFRFVDPGCRAEDTMDGDITDRITTVGDSVNTAKAFYSLGSCSEIQKSALHDNTTVNNGYYYITVKTPTKGNKRLRVYCDFETDGGGYTYYAVENGKATSGKQDANSCEDHGLQIAVPRSNSHFASMISLFSPSKYFVVVPGVYGSESSMDPTKHAMNSNSSVLGDKWKAIDAGSWYVNDAPFVPAQSQFSQYVTHCWLSMFGWEPGNYKIRYQGSKAVCEYQTRDYICSTNDKGGIGINVTSHQEVNTHATGSEPGKYIISYRVLDSSGNKECASPSRTVIVQDRLAPVISVKLNGKSVISNPLTDATGKLLVKENSLMQLDSEHTVSRIFAPAALCVGGVILAFQTLRGRAFGPSPKRESIV